MQRKEIEKRNSDIANLVEFIRRVREERRWDVSGLAFYDVAVEDIFGNGDIFSG